MVGLFIAFGSLLSFYNYSSGHYAAVTYTYTNQSNLQSQFTLTYDSQGFPITQTQTYQMKCNQSRFLEQDDYTSDNILSFSNDFYGHYYYINIYVTNNWEVPTNLLVYHYDVKFYTDSTNYDRYNIYTSRVFQTVNDGYVSNQNCISLPVNFEEGTYSDFTRIQYTIDFMYMPESIFETFSSDSASSYSNGFIDGQSSGYSQGYDDGYIEGQDDSTDRLQASFDNGYSQGYNEGLNDSSHNPYTFGALFGAVADTPILIVRSMFDFDFFGVNVLTVVLSLFTALILFYLLRKLF